MSKGVWHFLVLQMIGAALLIAAGLSNFLTQPFTGNTWPMCWLVTVVGLVGLWFVYMRKWSHVSWIAEHVVRLGLAGTVLGLIIAFSTAHNMSGGAEQVELMIARVVDGMYVALYATLTGVVVNLWLKINLKLLADYNE